MSDRWHAFAQDERVQQGLKQAEQAFMEPGLRERLAREQSAAAAGGTKVFRIGNSLRVLTEGLAFLAVAQRMGAQIDLAAWDRVRETFLPVLLAMPRVVVQNQDRTPPWNADLWTADIGMALAITLHHAVESFDDQTAGALRAFVLERCLRPILADWLDPQTRLHSLDSMGHNWWSVVVGGAGVMAAVLDRPAELQVITAGLREWFRFAGNELSHKRPNFGAEGDFVEGFAYGEYVLLNVCVFTHVYPTFRIVPDGLTEQQLRGLARWLGRAFVRDGDHDASLRFGDIGLAKYKPRCEVWHTIAHLAGDDELLAKAHRLKPSPHFATELLMWRPAPTRFERRVIAPIERFDTSGLAFLTRDDQTVAVRAGEAWNHNHMDAGSFILHEQETIWIDDCGTCTYSRPEYVPHYTSPAAHNVAYAPDLAPPTGVVMREGTGVPAHFVYSAADDAVSVVCAETGTLSGGALKRSYRWFIQLQGGRLVVWDDLAGYRPVRWVSLLHTMAEVDAASDATLTLRKNSRSLVLHPFADPPAARSIEPMAMGESRDPSAGDPRDQIGRCIAFTCEPADRARFGLATGSSLERVTWSRLPNDGGWQCEMQAGTMQWHIWFNPRADGRVMHENCTARWGEFETDAYALIACRTPERRTVHLVHGSFLRSADTTLASALIRVPLAYVNA